MRIFRKNIDFFRNFEVSKKDCKEGRGSRGTLRVLRAETWLTVYRTIAINTETVAKPGRLGPAQNGKLMENFIGLTYFCIITLMKAHRISCPEYIEDLYKCIRM